MTITSKEIYKTFELLNKNDIEYIMIKNIDNELPDNLKEGKDIDIIVHPNSFKAFRSIIFDNGFIQIIHPFGAINGWIFLDKCAQVSMYVCMYNGIYLDVCHALCCKALRHTYWVALPDCFQERIWKHKWWDDELNCWRMDETTLLAYLFVRSVFDKHEFSSDYVAEIEARKQMLDSNRVQALLASVFFSYAQKLIKLARTGKYASIINDFYDFAGDM